MRFIAAGCMFCNFKGYVYLKDVLKWYMLNPSRKDFEFCCETCQEELKRENEVLEKRSKLILIKGDANERPN